MEIMEKLKTSKTLKTTQKRRFKMIFAYAGITSIVLGIIIILISLFKWLNFDTEMAPIFLFVGFIPLFFGSVLVILSAILTILI